MPAPGTDQALSSISSSGHVDGLGRRVLAFDRETGAILERLYLRPEVAAFESAIRDRIDLLASLEDERFARPGSIERDPATGELTVLSEFVAGSRLSDLLETAEEGGLVPGVDVALGFLLEALPALGAFHAATGLAHGLIAPPRMVLTPAGQIVFLDPAFGGVVERLGLSRSRLWTQLEIGAPPGRGPVTFDTSADVAQVALSAVMLVIGRRLREHEYPGALPSLVSEVVEVAQIRGSSEFASTLQRLLERALPPGDAHAAVPADDLANEIRLLLRREIGMEVCRQALVDFTEQMDAAFPSARADEGADGLGTAAIDTAAGGGPSAFDLDRLTLEALDTLEVLDVEAGDPLADGTAEEDDDEDDAFEEIALDAESLMEADLPPAESPDDSDEPLPEPSPEPAFAADESHAELSNEPLALSSSAPEEYADLPPLPPKEVNDPWRFDPAAAERAAEALPAEPPPFDELPAANPPAASGPSFSGAEPTFTASGDADSPAFREPFPDAFQDANAGPLHPEPVSEPEPISASGPSATEPPSEPAPPEAEDAFPASPRRKKRQHRSARARKDRLRSAAEPKTPAKSPEVRPQGSWLVNPDRASSFAPPVPEPTPPQLPPVIGHPAPAPPPIQAAAPPPAPVVPVVTPPAAPPIPMPVYGTPAVPPSTPVAQPVRAVSPPAAPPKLKTIAPAGAPLRLKEQTSVGHTRPRPAQTFAAGYVHRETQMAVEPPRRFPWKLALLLLVIVAAAVAIGRTYLPSSGASDEEEGGIEASAGAQEPAVVVMPKIETGHITIDTQPQGARVLLDGKPVGQSPLKLADVPVGRHTLTFVSSSGRVSRTVEVEPGKTAVVDASIFSGWVAIFAPVVLDVAVNGRSIGTTERDRLMLAPGRHQLTLTHKELGYKTLQIVEVQPGEVRTVRLDPRGPVSFNAIPWAEVWLDGKKLGDTPLANVQVPIGIQEFVFKHPEFGERKVSATIRATGTEALSVDFTRQGWSPQSP